MIYSESFKQRVLAVLPGEDMKKRLDEGQTIVGRFLDDNSSGGVSLDLIAAMTVEDFPKLQAVANRQQKIRALYDEWQDEYRRQITPHLLGR